MAPPVLARPVTDGVVTLRAPRAADAAVFIAGRDDVFRRWLGQGSSAPQPTAAIVVDDRVVGWVDHDADGAWLRAGEVNVGYNVFAPHRGKGHATRAVQLLMHHLARDTDHRRATLRIDPGNESSLAVAARTGFVATGVVADGPTAGQLAFFRDVPPLTYSDGVVVLRRQHPEDIDADLEAKDDAQITWMWGPGEREAWLAMTPERQRSHALRGLVANHAAFGGCPKWTFAVDLAGGPHAVAYVDVDLANEHVPRGEANIAYSTHPAHRRRGHARRAVLLVLEFLREHTAARTAHVLVDAGNAASLRVARAAGAVETERWSDARGRPMVRHVIALPRP
jgi:RimJ/RimL family protein N-acetyltransferase